MQNRARCQGKAVACKGRNPIQCGRSFGGHASAPQSSAPRASNANGGTPRSSGGSRCCTLAAAGAPRLACYGFNSMTGMYQFAKRTEFQSMIILQSDSVPRPSSSKPHGVPHIGAVVKEGNNHEAEVDIRCLFSREWKWIFLMPSLYI